jgi:hypothetical protein
MQTRKRLIYDCNLFTCPDPNTPVTKMDQNQIEIYSWNVKPIDKLQFYPEMKFGNRETKQSWQ